MGNNKTTAFTLIEVMVVLSILAIIAILAYNFFGSTMKEARRKSLATEILKQASTASMMMEKYQMDTGLYNPDQPGLTSGLDFLTDAGLTKNTIDFPMDARADGWEVINWVIYSNQNHFGTAEPDVYLHHQRVDPDICAAINGVASPSGIGDRIWSQADGDPTFIPAGEIASCIKNGTVYYLYYFVEIN